METARTQPKRGPVWIAGICVILTLVLTGMYFKEKAVLEELSTDEIWYQRAEELARIALDVPHYVDTHNLERNMYSDEKVFRHFVEVGLPNGLEYRFREGMVEDAERIQQFWQTRLQEVSSGTQ